MRRGFAVSLILLLRIELMKIHEYQAKQLLAAAGVPVPKGIVARTPDEAASAFTQLGRPVAVVKSQIHAGGRGKGTFKEHPQQRGVVLVKSAEEARDNAARMLGNTLVTIQTGAEGKQVNVVFVEAGLDIARELYLGIVVDREVGGPVLIMSSEGGMEIEEVAAHSPEKILSEPVDADYGLFRYQARKLAFTLGLEGQRDPLGGIVPAEDLPVLPRQRLQHGGDQSAGRHEAGGDARPRCQGHVRRQRPVPPQGVQGAARPERRRTRWKSAPANAG